MTRGFALPMAVRAILFLLLTFLPFSVAAQSQDPAPAAQAGSGSPSAAELEDLLAVLEDDAARKQFVAQLRALVEAQRATPEPETFSARALDYLADRVSLLSDQVASAADAFSDAPRALDWLETRFRRQQERDRFIELTAQLALILAVAYLASVFMRIVLRRPHHALERPVASRIARVPLVLGRVLLDFVPIGAFALAGYALLTAFDPPPAFRVVTLLVLNANIAVYVTLALARVLLSPGIETLRILPITTESAHYAYIWVRRLAVTVIYGYMIAGALRLLGMPYGPYIVLLKLAGLVVLVLVVILILQNRHDVADALRGGPPPTGRHSAALRSARRRLADVWHVLAIAYVVLIYGIWAFNVAGGFGFMLRATILTLLILIAARWTIRGLRLLVQRSFRIPSDLHAQFPRLQGRANLYLPILDRVLTGLVWLIAGVALLWAWGIDTFEWINSPTGRRVVSAVVSIGIVLALAVLAWELASTWIERYLTGRSADGVTVERSARIRTLLPLMRNALFIVLVVIVSLIVMSELGINIAPLLAGAGVIGLAIGFGSQTLVKDIITGLFILFEDTISVGDVVNIGSHGGLVEGMTIRTIRLRDYSGNVHTIPFSEVTTIMNMTKEFSFYVFEVGVAYREDVDEVMQVLRDLGAEMQADPKYGDLIVEPIDVAGVERFDDSAVVIKARIKTKPIQQWTVGREFNRRMKKRFDELGIEIPFPQRTVWFGEPKTGTAPAGNLVVRTAPAALEAPGPERPAVAPSPPSDVPGDLPPGQEPEDDSDR